MNEILFFVCMLVNYFGMLLVYRLLGKKGLYAWIGLATVFANIELLRSVDMFGMSVTLGNTLFSTMFMIQHIVEQEYGKKEAQKTVWTSFLILILFTLFSQIDLLFKVSAVDWSDEAFKTLFTLTPRIAIMSAVAFFCSSGVNIGAFRLLKKLFKGKHLWLSDDLSSYLAQVVDNTIFAFGAFLFIYSIPTILTIILFSAILEFVLAFLDTPIFYLARKIHKTIQTKETSEAI